MKRIPIFLVIFLSFEIFLYSNNDMPAWVKKLPESNKQMVYFVGKSERAENYENYLEAKAGALMDVLMQFSIYKGAKIEQLIKDQIEQLIKEQDDESTNLSSLESVIRLSANNNSAGLYQQAEWMAKDGILYVLYSFSSVSGNKTNPRQDLTSFRDFQLVKDRIYFTAMAVANNAEELPALAEQSAKMDVLIWLGADISGSFNDYVKEEGKVQKTDIDSSFEAALKCTSQINLESLSFNKEQHSQIEKDKKYHYYGLYSISAAKFKNAKEYECFSYYTKSKYGTKLSESFEKQVNFNGSRFTRNKPYAMNKPYIDGTVPQAVKDAVKDTYRGDEHLLVGVGDDKNTSAEIQNMRAAISAIAEIGRQTSAIVKSMSENYAPQSGIEEKGKESSIKLEKSISITQMFSNVSISKAVKIHDELNKDAALWQVWSAPKANIKAETPKRMD